MEDAKLLRMATAISQYTISNMLLENVQTASAMLDQAALSVEHLPWIPERVSAELLQRQHEVSQFRQTVQNYQKEVAAEVEEAQKALMMQRQEQASEDKATNFEMGV